MSTSTALDLYDLPLYNASSEVIPAHAVVQQTWQGEVTGRDYFRAAKPNGLGKKFALNGPLPIPVGGQGRGTTARGMPALFDPNITPQTDEELGPVPGQWFLGRGYGGFLVDGGIEGSPASAPGFPSQASTRRVRVTQHVASTPALTLRRFELKLDKALPSPPFGEAYLLDAQDNYALDNNGRAIEVIVVDRLTTKYAGFGPYTDKQFGPQAGFRGWGQFITSDYAGTGRAAYEIIEMEGQARWIIGKLAADWEPEAFTGEMIVETFHGAAPNGRSPRTFEKDYGGGGTGQPSDKKNVVSIYDPVDFLKATAKKDEKIIAVFNEQLNRYVLAAPPVQAIEPLVLGWIHVSVPAATIDYQNFKATLGATKAAAYEMDVTKAEVERKKDSNGAVISLAVLNSSTSPIRATTDEPVLMWGGKRKVEIDGTEVDALCPSPFEIRQIQNFDKAKAQVVWHNEGSGSSHLDAEKCPPPAQ